MCVCVCVCVCVRACVRACVRVCQTCQLSRVTRESHGFLHFLQSHGRGNSCSRVYSCPTVLFSHRLLPIIIAGNTFWQHKFSVNETEACFLATGKFRGATEAT